MNNSLHTRGVAAIEVVIGVTIAGIIIAYAANAITQFLDSARIVTLQTQAIYLAEEGIEMIRFVRDNDWAEIENLTEGDSYYLEVASSSVSITETPQSVGEFSRSFVVHNIYRNASSDDIVASTTVGSVEDEASKYVTVTVSWGSPADDVSLTSIVADISP